MRTCSLLISDDDLCASCKYLAYYPGEESHCTKANGFAWPCMFDLDGYSISCDQHKLCKPGENLMYREARQKWTAVRGK